LFYTVDKSLNPLTSPTAKSLQWLNINKDTEYKLTTLTDKVLITLNCSYALKSRYKSNLSCFKHYHNYWTTTSLYTTTSHNNIHNDLYPSQSRWTSRNKAHQRNHSLTLLNVIIGL